jgi:hypothetical protein
MVAPREPLPSLPDDAAALPALVLAALAERDAVAGERDAVANERDAAVTERDALLAQNDRLRHLLLKLTRMHFGARSERLPEEQLQLGLEALEQAIAKEDAQAEKQDAELRRDNAAKRRTSRGALPAHLPRIEVTLTPEDTACPCCRTPMTVIGEDSAERLDVIPAQFRVGLPPWEWRVEIRASCNCTHSDCLHAGARLNWGAIADARVQALTIVEDFDVVEHRRLRLLAGVEADLVDVLRLE